MAIRSRFLGLNPSLLDPYATARVSDYRELDYRLQRPPRATKSWWYDLAYAWKITLATLIPIALLVLVSISAAQQPNEGSAWSSSAGTNILVVVLLFGAWLFVTTFMGWHWKILAFAGDPVPTIEHLQHRAQDLIGRQLSKAEIEAYYARYTLHRARAQHLSALVVAGAIGVFVAHEIGRIESTGGGGL